MDLIDLHSLLNGAPDDDHVICPTCSGAGYVEDPYGPCDRCGRACYIHMDDLTPTERAMLERLVSLDDDVFPDRWLADQLEEVDPISSDDEDDGTDD